MHIVKTLKSPLDHDCSAKLGLFLKDDFIQCKLRLLRRAQSRWGIQRGEAAALPFGRTRGFKPRVRYNLINS